MRMAITCMPTATSPRNRRTPGTRSIFQNPLKFPMTTASATIREDGQFRGQSQSNWTNPGQRSCLHITKALSLQTDHTEVEESGKRENEVWIGGRRYYRTTVKAEATARNFRSAPVTLLMKAQFSGALVEAEEKPGDTLRREGVFSVNPRHELEWKLTLAARGGEEGHVSLYGAGFVVRMPAVGGYPSGGNRVRRRSTRSSKAFDCQRSKGTLSACAATRKGGAEIYAIIPICSSKTPALARFHRGAFAAARGRPDSGRNRPPGTAPP